MRGYHRLVYRDLWPGIDLIYHGTSEHLKYEFVVQPGADPTAIRLRYRGITRAAVEPDGRMNVSTPVASFSDDRPELFQEIDGARRSVAGGFRTAPQAGDAVEFGFTVGEYDRTQPLVIDPAVLIFCGYVGASGEEYVKGIASDAAGNLYMAGYTSSLFDFPVTKGPDVTSNGVLDGFVAKVRPDGTGFVYCGFIGGPGADMVEDVAVDAQGNAYVAGWTDGNLPVLNGPDLTFNGGYTDVFVAKVNPQGTALVYSGYLGGDAGEQANGIAVDASGSAYVVGGTYSTDATFPAVGGPVLHTSGNEDGFIAKVLPDGTGLAYSGFLGGTSFEEAMDVAVDQAGSAYVCGYTGSETDDFPLKVGPSTSTHLLPNGFIAKVTPSGSDLVYCGYIGGNDFDYAWGVAVDAQGVAYVCGMTYGGTGFPVVGGPDPTANGKTDGFLARIRADGTGFLSSGYIGGTEGDSAMDVAVDNDGFIYVAGFSESDGDSFPVVNGPDPTNNGYMDTFVLKLRPGALTYDFCGFIGGASGEYPAGIALAPYGGVYVGGSTASSQQSFPVKTGPDLSYGGGPQYVEYDGFVVRVQATPALAPELVVTTPAGGGARLAWTDLNPGRTGFEIERKIDGGAYVTRAALGASAQTYDDDGLLSGGGYTYRLRATTEAGVSPYSNEVHVVIPDGGPEAPADLVASVFSPTHVGLDWRDTNGGQAATRIERSMDGGPFLLVATAFPGDHGYGDTTVTGGHTYTYRLIAVLGARVSPPSNTFTVDSSVHYPAGPSPVATLQEGPSIRVDWTNHAEGVTGFIITRAELLGRREKLAQVGGSAATYTDATVQLGTTYYYSVQAVSAGGVSFSVDTLPVTVPAGPSQTPEGLQTQLVSSRAIDLMWFPTNYLDTFLLYRQSGSSGFSLVATLPGSTLSYQDTVQPQTTYAYRIVAKNVIGESAPSAPITVTTPAEGKLVVTPARLKFPTTRVGRTAKKVVTLKNTGLGPLRIQGYTLSAPFTAPLSTEFLLEPRKSLKVTINYSPTSPSAATGSLVVRSEINTVTVPLSGRARP